MPEDIPETFETGELLSAAALNRLQRQILARLAAHDHTGGAMGENIQTGGIADRAVTEPKLADGAVSARVLADDAVTSRTIADGAITAPHLSDGAVTTDAILDNAVTEQKLSATLRALLVRTGDNASSASQVVWRDPIVMFPPLLGTDIIVGILNPGSWAWEPTVFGVNELDEPVTFSPNIDPNKTIKVVDLNPVVQPAFFVSEANFNTASLDAADNLIAVGASGLALGTEVRGDTLVGMRTTQPMMAQPAMQPMMMRMHMTADTTAGASTGNSPTAEFRTMAARDVGRDTGDLGRAATGTQPAATKPTVNGQLAAQRMMTIANVDADGKPVGAGDAGAMTVSSGFSGQSNFVNGNAIDFNGLEGTNTNALNNAAGAAGKILFNLGIDSDYLETTKQTTEISQHLSLALDADRAFFDAAKPLWGGQSWLPGILNNPQLFGTGYALSGGRNILSVTRQFKPGDSADHWVRVRFITPYRNAAYAVTVTPRSRVGHDMVTANIRAKNTHYVDIQFTGAEARDGDTVRFERLSKLSFDLAVFGELGQAE